MQDTFARAYTRPLFARYLCSRDALGLRAAGCPNQRPILRARAPSFRVYAKCIWLDEGSRQASATIGYLVYKLGLKAKRAQRYGILYTKILEFLKSLENRVFSDLENS